MRALSPCGSGPQGAGIHSWLAVALGLVLTVGGFAADKSGVSPNTISLPKGPGSIEGLGESFQPSLNSGTAKYGVALKLPPGTAGQTPELRLAYESGSGNGPLGLGWQLPLPYIQRRTDHGVPTYGLPVGFPRQDTFINEAREELVPQDDGFLFCKNEGTFVRYRQLAEHWEATRPDGTRLIFGESAAARLEDSTPGRVFAWLLEKEIDTHGNVIVYTYGTFAGAQNAHQKFLLEIRYGPGAPPWANFHFAHFLYEDRLDWFEDCRPGFPLRTGKRLRRIDVGTQGPVLVGHQAGDFNDDGVSDHLVRAYDLAYLGSPGAPSHGSLLASVRLIGADGTNSLPASTFGYSICDPPEELSAATQELSAANEPAFLFDNPLVDLVDLNGDGLPDLLKTGGLAHQAFLNLGETNAGGVRSVGWSNPIELRAEAGEAWTMKLDTQSTHLADMNGDGLADLVHKAGPRDVFYFANTGRLGWTERQPMALENFPPPAPFGETDVRTADVDFDKHIDLIRADGLQYHVWFNRGSNSYSERISVPSESPANFALTGVHLADFNGDRLPDLCRIHPLTLEIKASLGYGKFLDPVVVPIPDRMLDPNLIAQATLTDINGDGLVDLVLPRAEPGVLWYWLNLGNYRLTSPRRVTGMPIPAGPAVATRWADLNGNGTTDLVYADRFAQPGLRAVDLGQLLNCGAALNSLVVISNGIGRVTLIGYQPSTRYALEDAAAGQPWPDAMPVPITVVASVTNLDSLGHSYRTHFRYHHGYYDAVEKQFRGFGHVEQIDVGDSTAPTLITRSYFDTGRHFEVMKGKVLRVTAEQEDGRVFTDDTTRWTTPPLTLMTGTNGQPVHYAHPIAAVKIIHELGQGQERRLEFEMDYDRYGNQTRAADFGVVDGNDRSASNDERITHTQFALNTKDWLLRLPSQIENQDEHGQVTSRVQLFYDDETFSGNNLGQISVGNLTLRREWTNPADSAAFIPVSRAKYDRYGNVTQQLDPLAAATTAAVALAKSHTRTIAYDARFHAYPVAETIHLGARQEPLLAQGTYNEGFGALLNATDFNGHATTFRYDAFARLVSIIKPGDPDAFPTIQYDYLLAQPVPAGLVNFIETRLLDQKAGAAASPQAHYFISRQFLDGLGRPLMTKTEAEPEVEGGSARAVVSGAVQFNSRQKPGRVLNSFFTTLAGNLNDLLAFEHIEEPGWSGQFAQPAGLTALDLAQAPSTTTLYDATLRETGVVHPDGNQQRTVYEPLLRRTYDENDLQPASPHRDTPMVHHQDGLNRLIRVDEVVGLTDDGQPGPRTEWTTRYEYDLNDQLTRITDAQGNVKTFTYDALKRKTALGDPNRGRMGFTYDDAGNLIESIDAKLQRITYTYDGANRILTEDYHDQTQPFSAAFTYDPAAPLHRTNRPDVVYFYDVPVPNLDQGDSTTATARNTRGALACVWDLSGEEHTSYNARGSIEWVVKRIPDPLTRAASSNSFASTPSSLVSYKTSYTHDSLDRLSVLTYPDADQLRYEYNERNLLQRIPGGFKPGSTQPGYLLSQIQYLPSGQTAEIHFGNGVRTTYAYDTRLRLRQLLTQRPPSPGIPSPSGNEELIHFQYELDDASNIRSIEDRRPATLVPDGDSHRNTQHFDYDDLYRLTRVSYSFAAPGAAPAQDGEINYRYDRIGNMLAQTSNLAHEEKGLPVANLGVMECGGALGRSGRTERQPSDPPGPHALTSIRNPNAKVQDRSYRYDANGNMTELDGLTCTWDFKDRLVAVENDEMRASYTYDFTDRRITKRVHWKPRAPDPDAHSSKLEHPKSLTVTYVNKYFEVREHDAPTKYVWNGHTRVARVTGSLTTNVRVQRLRVRPGWNLCSLAVSSDDLLAQLTVANPQLVQSVFRWNSSAHDWAPVLAGQALPAGTVLWLQARTNAILALTGRYADPAVQRLGTDGDFLPGAGLEPLSLREVKDGVSMWTYDASSTSWMASLFPPLQSSPLPAVLAPGEAVFARAATNTVLEVPDDALRIQYYHQDHLGSTCAVSGSGGEQLESHAFYPFGAERATGQPGSRRAAYLFTQKETDAESRLQYFEARFCGNNLARFLSADPLVKTAVGGLLQTPQRLHAYSYVQNQPLTFIDPTGKFSVGEFMTKAFDQASENFHQMTKAFDQSAAETHAIMDQWGAELVSSDNNLIKFGVGGTLALAQGFVPKDSMDAAVSLASAATTFAKPLRIPLSKVSSAVVTMTSGVLKELNSQFGSIGAGKQKEFDFLKFGVASLAAFSSMKIGDKASALKEQAKFSAKRLESGMANGLLGDIYRSFGSRTKAASKLYDKTAVLIDQAWSKGSEMWQKALDEPKPGRQ